MYYTIHLYIYTYTKIPQYTRNIESEIIEFSMKWQAGLSLFQNMMKGVGYS
jgi:hypothetical protein